MKKVLNTILIINTIYVLACSENQDLTVFFLPADIYLVAGFLRINVRKFNSILNIEK
jgi:hypothetical protein